MKKILLMIIIIIASLFSFGCNNDDSNNMVKLNSVDISSLNNKKMKAIVNDDTLDEGVYQIITDSNTYIYFLGKNHEFKDIGCSIEDNILNITASLSESESLDDSNEVFKKLFVIYEKNTTSSDDKAKYFDSINLVIDNKDSSFNNIYSLVNNL